MLKKYKIVGIAIAILGTIALTLYHFGYVFISNGKKQKCSDECDCDCEAGSECK